MRRTCLLVLAVALASALFCSVSAAGSLSTVRNAEGRPVGYVAGSRSGNVYDASRLMAGEFGPTDEEVFVFRGTPEPFGLVDRASSNRFLVRTSGPSARAQGRALRTGPGRKWTLQRRVRGTWKTRGRVSSSASSWAAGAGCDGGVMADR